MYEIERKWLFDSINVPEGVDKICDVIYRQAYISTEPEMRLCSEESETVNTYSLTFKDDGLIKRRKIKKYLTKGEFRDIMSICNIKEEDMIQKPTSIYSVDGYTMILCSVDKGTKDGFIYGEIEFESEEDANNFEAPSWFGKEVTYDNYYKMRNYWKRVK